MVNLNSKTFGISNDHKYFRIGDFWYPVHDAYLHDTPTNLSEAVFRLRHAVVVFENGLELSFAWGSGTYSSNKFQLSWTDNTTTFSETPETVEVLIVNNLDKPSSGSNLFAYQTVDDVRKIIGMEPNKIKQPNSINFAEL